MVVKAGQHMAEVTAGTQTAQACGSRLVYQLDLL
jgi:hypothetical protein